MNQEMLQELQERYAERQALTACRSASFATCLEAFGIPLTITVITPKGTPLSIHASDIYATRKKFFAQVAIEQEQCRLTSIGDRVVDLYMNWLMHDYTKRYRSLASDDHRQWLKQVIVLIVARHILERKYEMSLSQGQQFFADPWVYREMYRLRLLNSLPGQLAQLVHHIVRDETQAQELLDLFHVDLDMRMKRQPFSLPESLPPLPSGVHVPLMLPTNQEVHDNV